MYFLIFSVLMTGCLGEILSPAWQQYYPSTQSWSHQSTAGYTPDTISLRPPRHRVGQGRYRLIPPASAELNCDFPESMLMISNVVWERADIGSRDLHQIYKRAGVPHQYDVHIRPRGSTLHIFDVTPLDRGIYRCIATGMDPSTNNVVTLFQDTDFFPEQTLPLTNLIKRDYIVPATAASTPVYVSTYYRPSSYNGYSPYSTPVYSTPIYPTASYHTPSHPNPSYASYPTPSSYTVDSEFIYSSGNTKDTDNSNKIYVYDKGSYPSYMTDRNDHVNITSDGDEKQGAADNVDYKS
ncbi:hypothetical protein M8J76_015691 [Diaphorina citri]|nr:hypothetical protein M8J76_015691 [Diaphorina citri]